MSTRYIIGTYYPNVLNENFDTITYALAIMTSIRVLTDICLYSLLISLLVFFISKKQQALNAQKLPMSCFNISMIVWIVFLVISNAAYRIVLSFQFFGVVAQGLKTSTFYPPVAVYVFTIWPITTILTALTLTYLFYYQA